VPVDYAGYLQQPTACGSDQPDLATEMQFDAPGDAKVDRVTVVTLNTSCGDIAIELDPEVAPEAVNSFVFLAESGYFDGTVSHRVIPGFMMQAGDQTATGRGGPGYALPDELPTNAAPYTRGVVAMANAGPGTTGSQFFIMFEDVDWLSPQYTVVGEVTAGLETLDLIADVPLGSGATSADPTPSTPLESVYIVSVSVER
jgi:cyclophilin family peptidyl-prolyl cis-trans isomerase